MVAKQGAWKVLPQIQAPWHVSVSLTPDGPAKSQVRGTNRQPLRDFAQQAWHIAQLSFPNVGALLPTPGIVILEIFLRSLLTSYLYDGRYIVD